MELLSLFRPLRDGGREAAGGLRAGEPGGGAGATAVPEPPQGPAGPGALPRHARRPALLQRPARRVAVQTRRHVRRRQGERAASDERDSLPRQAEQNDQQ